MLAWFNGTLSQALARGMADVCTFAAVPHRPAGKPIRAVVAHTARAPAVYEHAAFVHAFDDALVRLAALLELARHLPAVHLGAPFRFCCSSPTAGLRIDSCERGTAPGLMRPAGCLRSARAGLRAMLPSGCVCSLQKQSAEVPCTHSTRAPTCAWAERGMLKGTQERAPVVEVWRCEGLESGLCKRLHPSAPQGVADSAPTRTPGKPAVHVRPLLYGTVSRCCYCITVAATTTHVSTASCHRHSWACRGMPPQTLHGEQRSIKAIL